MNLSANLSMLIVSSILMCIPTTVECFSHAPMVSHRGSGQPKFPSKVHSSTSINDEEILSQVSEEYLGDLCRRLSLKDDGTKEDLLLRLRAFGEDQARLEKDRLEQRRKRIDEGEHDEREIFESLGTEEDEDEEENLFYCAALSSLYPIEQVTPAEAAKTQKSSASEANESSVFWDEEGQRVETVFSTTEENDLTSIAAAQPGQSNLGTSIDTLSSASTKERWDENNPSRGKDRAATQNELDVARREISDLIQFLLSQTRLKGFAPEGNFEAMPTLRQAEDVKGPSDFVPFQPSSVPADVLKKASPSLRMDRGKVLAEVSREFELRGVGFDGLAGDEVDKGGGHYREATKVRSFLEGYRQAEVGKLARETLSLLLDRLVTDGIEGLDIALASMSRSGQVSGSNAGELNDSLLEFLNDVIRQQEKKVEQVVDSTKNLSELELSLEDKWVQRDSLSIDELWSVANIDGERVETFDPRDPASAKALELESQREQHQPSVRPPLPQSSAEKLLLLLKLLRDRLKVEALYPQDDKSQNLRVLSYCLRLESTELQKEMIAMSFGKSVDRLDSFAELVNSAIEYAESTSHQLFPSKIVSLNSRQLDKVLVALNEIRSNLTSK